MQGSVGKMTPSSTRIPTPTDPSRCEHGIHPSFDRSCLSPLPILLIDDDPDILTALTDLFDHAGYGVTAVSTCVEALSKIETRRFVAVLLDICLPDGDGLSLLDRMQAVAPSLPVIVLTALLTSGSTAGALSRGAFACLAKPYDRQVLLTVIRKAIHAQLPPPQTGH